MTEQEILAIVQRAIANPQSYTTETLADFGLDNVECDKCNNTGHIITKRDGMLYSRECDCMAKRKALRSLKRSGMEKLLSRYSLADYETPDDKRMKIKNKATSFIGSDDGWFVISGASGSGKTHICTAICNGLIERGKSVRYMLWRDASVELKSLVTNAEEYRSKIDAYKDAQVLYIDDFLKGKVTEADINLAYELINYRYVSDKMTIISSERDIEDITQIDEALGGRIYEMSRGFCLKAPNENWRFRQ